MLEELHLRGLGVIDDAVLSLGPGLTVVTGETGAGKTMVVTGLLLLFGGRADSARVRAGAAQASVDGRLELNAEAAVAERVRGAGGDLDDGTGLVLRRTVSAAGRSRAFVGGAATPVGVLSELADRLVAVHGQSDQLRLTRPGEQRRALDRFAGIELGEYATAFAEWRRAANALDERVARAAELRREAGLLAYGLAEIRSADPQPGEDTELATQSGRLAHADALRLAAHAAHDALLGDADDPTGEGVNALGLVDGARRGLLQQAGADPELDGLAGRFADLEVLAADLGADCGAYAAGLDADPARLEQIESRRAVLAALIRKYAPGPGDGVDAVLSWAQQAQARLDDIDVSDEAIAALTARRDDARADVQRLAAVVSDQRVKAAGELAEAVSSELAGLAMPSSHMSVRIDPTPPGPTGAEEVEFLLQPHPDAPALPIARGASGGELSRVMLALEVCLAGTDPVPTMVFDEVDAGVGGRAAVEVGRRLARLSRTHQVVVVTHLAQVAAYADRHIVVDKHTGGGVTASDVHPVTDTDRVAELARMLAGSASTTALEHAAELLQTAAEERAQPARPDNASVASKSRSARRSSARSRS